MNFECDLNIVFLGVKKFYLKLKLDLNFKIECKYKFIIFAYIFALYACVPMT